MYYLMEELEDYTKVSMEDFKPLIEIVEQLHQLVVKNGAIRNFYEIKELLNEMKKVEEESQLDNVQSIISNLMDTANILDRGGYLQFFILLHKYIQDGDDIENRLDRMKREFVHKQILEERYKR